MSLSGVQHTVQGKDLEVILTVKIETRHPIGGKFGCEFSVFVVTERYDGLKSQDLEI